MKPWVPPTTVLNLSLLFLATLTGGFLCFYACSGFLQNFTPKYTHSIMHGNRNQFSIRKKLTTLLFLVTERVLALLSNLCLLLEYVPPPTSGDSPLSLCWSLEPSSICCLPPTLCHLSHSPQLGVGVQGSSSTCKCHHVSVRAGTVMSWAPADNKPDFRLFRSLQGRRPITCSYLSSGYN